MSEQETLTELLAIRQKIADCRTGDTYTPWLIPSTLRHKAMELAAAFVDPHWNEEPRLSKEIDPLCGF